MCPLMSMLGRLAWGQVLSLHRHYCGHNEPLMQDKAIARGAQHPLRSSQMDRSTRFLSRMNLNHSSMAPTLGSEPELLWLGHETPGPV